MYAVPVRDPSILPDSGPLAFVASFIITFKLSVVYIDIAISACSKINLVPRQRGRRPRQVQDQKNGFGETQGLIENVVDLIFSERTHPLIEKKTFHESLI